MKPGNTVQVVLLRSIKLLAGLTWALILTGCTLGEAVMPSVTPGVAADRSVGLVAAVPAPIPHTADGREECFGCHAIGAVDAPPVPASHDQDVTLCTSCHTVWLAPVIAAAAPPAVRHDLEGHSDCLACHKLGTADAPRAPDNHSGLASSICLTCHTSVAELAGVDEAAEALPTEPPSIPHGLEGFGACTQCHGKGGSGIPELPDDHQGRTDDLCSACHNPAAETAAIAPTNGDTTTPTGSPSPAAGDAAKGEDLFAANCAVCHGPEGEGSAIAPNALNDRALLGDRTDEDLVRTIREGVTDKMPPFPDLSDKEILDLVALQRSW